MNDLAPEQPRRGRRRLRNLLQRRWLTAACLGAVCAAVGIAISLAKWPTPRVHDEFSYLLAADTFAHGRMANPTHPMWHHLESFHVLFEPTYASKYLPGQGLALAAGQVLTGEPAAGLWLLSGLAAAATYWMLLGWTSPRFAAFGALLGIAHPGLQLTWGQTYWGGTLAFIGGALVFGAALRMQHRLVVRESAIMGAGAVILAVTRPFEGLCFCVATGGWLLWRWTRHGRPPMRDLALKFVLPLGIVGGLGGAALGVYHQAVTGSPLTFPYAVHQAQYGQTPLILTGSPGPRPEYRHAVFDEFHSVWEIGWWQRQATMQSWFYSKIAVTWLAILFFMPPLLGLSVLASQPWRRSRLTPAVVVAGATYCATLVTTFYNPHYWAPFVPLLFVAATAGLRRIDVLGRRRFAGMRLAPMLVAGQIILFGIAAYGHVLTPKSGWEHDRAAVVAKLEQSPDRHLVVVRYGPRHNCHAEWVFNDADIDGSKIVWARSINPTRDAELLQYFADRQAWLLEPEARRLTPICRTAATNTTGRHEEIADVP